MFVSACFWATGFLVGALGIATGQLWLVYLGYGVIGGIGLGIGYISPVSTLIKWFPDRPGPGHRPGDHGLRRRRADRQPAVPATARRSTTPTTTRRDATSVACGGALGELFVTLGIGYFVIMMFGVFNIRVPRRGWTPAGFDPDDRAGQAAGHHRERLGGERDQDPQFWLLWIVLFCNVTAGIGILEQASPMIQDFFRSDGASTVTVAAAGGFVGLLSLFNMAGRFVWSSTSDLIGRKPIYMIYLGVGIVLYALLATVGHTATGAVRAARRAHHLLLRRRFRDRTGLPAGPLRHVPGRRHPRPAAHRLVRRRHRRPADHQRVPRRARASRAR